MEEEKEKEKEKGEEEGGVVYKRNLEVCEGSRIFFFFGD